MVANHLSHLTFSNDELAIMHSFYDEQMFSIQSTPRFSNTVNSLVASEMPQNWSSQSRRKFLYDVRRLFYDCPYLFKYY